MNERKVFIDYVRVLCMCFVVCVLHLSQYLNNDPIDYYLWHNPVFFKITYSALGAFSFISGYLMGGGKKYQSTCSFYKKRFIRVYPMFVFSTFLLYVIGLNGAKESIVGLVGLSPFVARLQPMTLWYMSMLMLFYAITPLVMKHNPIKVSILITILLLVLFILSRTGVIRTIIPQFILDNRFLYNCPIFLFGLCLRGDSRLMDFFKRRDFLIVGLLVWAFTLYVQRGGLLLTFTSGIVGVACIISISLWLEKLLGSNKIVNMLSYSSFAMYLMHRFVYYVVLYIYRPANNWAILIYMYLIAVPLCILFSYYIQKLFDRIKYSSNAKI